jgi:hypothetical protein
MPAAAEAAAGPLQRQQLQWRDGFKDYSGAIVSASRYLHRLGQPTYRLRPSAGTFVMMAGDCRGL